MRKRKPPGTSPWLLVLGVLALGAGLLLMFLSGPSTEPETNSSDGYDLARMAVSNFRGVLANLNRLPQFDPEEAAAYSSRARLYYESGSYNDAIAYLTRAIDLDPALADAYADRGFSYYLLGDFRSAVTDFSYALNLDPNNATLYYNRGHAYYYLDEHDRAVEDFCRYLALGGDDKAILVVLEPRHSCTKN